MYVHVRNVEKNGYKYYLWSGTDYWYDRRRLASWENPSIGKGELLERISKDEMSYEEAWNYLEELAETHSKE